MDAPQFSDGVDGLSVALDERDRPTQQHCDRVAGLCVELGQRCDLSAQDLRVLRLASMLHDVGKIGIPDGVLKKTGRFTAEDRDLMRTHSIRGERIVLAAELEDGAAIALAVRHHHERIDGTGYPDGLAGEAIPVLSRIIAIADAYDAMARLRAYSATRPHADIVEELRRGAGRQHDAYLIGKFAGMIDRSPFRARES